MQSKIHLRLKDSYTFLCKDNMLGAFVKKHGPVLQDRHRSPQTFEALAEAIIYQQISGKAAATIAKRFVALWPTKKFPTPKDVLKIKVEKLRSVGLSGQKSSYLKDLALRCTDGTINPHKFRTMTDAEIIEHVVVVKGIGEWTAQMFLMFTLHRGDVFPTGDLGIQKALQKVFKLKKLPTPERSLKLAQRWAGHRTLACMYLWRILDQA